MIIDHSQSYNGCGLRAIGHRHRLKTIFSELESMRIPQGGTYCDLGCSNGWITDQISQRFGLNAVGLDHKEEHLALGRSRHPLIEFGLVDLNKSYECERKFDLVTCFETFEHVGIIESAVQNIVNRIGSGGLGLISVPVENGSRGILKYCLKKYLFGYSASELRNV